jgi:hypothetical protein
LVVATFVVVELEMEEPPVEAFVEVVLEMVSSALVAFAGLGHRIEALVEGASVEVELEMEEPLVEALVAAADP